MKDLITKVLREHQWIRGQGCNCEQFCDWDDHPAHVASVLEAELQLTEERTEINGDPNGGWYGLRRRRWVSAWSPSEPENMVIPGGGMPWGFRACPSEPEAEKP